MSKTLLGSAVTAVVLCGAIFGFFYAWVCSTMWGLDRADPRVAIAAMQAMNDSVQNAVFFPAFFLTPVALALTAVLARARGRGAAGWFALGAGIYLVFGLIVTMGVNVPMNADLAAVAVPADREAAAVIWRDYSARWQLWNQVRAVASGIALICATLGVVRLATAHDQPAHLSERR